jgi:CO/xanthine dehydrogenase Mo-binding subunit
VGGGGEVAVVAVDVDTGKVDILDYAIVEDCGTVVNPLIVDGQINTPIQIESINYVCFLYLRSK